MATSSSSGHTRSRGSKGSITSSVSNGRSSYSIEASSAGIAHTNNVSPASATKAASIARQASMAKKRGGTPGTAKAPSTGAATTTPRRSSAISAAGSSTSMSRNGLSSSSSGASVALQDTSSDPATGGEDLEFTDATTPDELSRLTREQLVALILREREDKEEAQTKLSILSTEHATIAESQADLLKTQALQDTKLQDSYASSERLEKELSEQIETLENTRESLREAEKTSRELQKRLNDQIQLFDSEQAKWTEIEQSLHSQISRLNDDHQALLAKQQNKFPTVVDMDNQSAEDQQIEKGLESSKSMVLSPTPSHLLPASPTFQIPESTLEELQMLHTRVAELSSEQSTLQDENIRLQNELEEVQRVNSDLQEQNENYEVLLSERMIAGLNIFPDSGHASSLNTSSLRDGSTTGSRPPSALDRLEEEEDVLSSEDDEPDLFESLGDGNLSTGAVAANMTPNRIKHTAKKRQSVMALGSAGGLDLEAELDRARREEEEDRKKAEEKAQRRKDRDNAARRRANQSSATIGDTEPIPNDIEALRKELKLLRQENKGLSTYVSKILEKIIGIEGFEKVLSVERDPKPASTPTTTVQTPPPPTPAKTGSFLPSTLPTKLQPVRTPSGSANPAVAAPLSPTGPPPNIADNKKKNRFSMDWFGSSLFKGSSNDTSQSAASGSGPVTSGTSAPAPGLKPMRLTGGPAQKTATVEEDEDDRRTRARLQSEMRLLGIETSSSPAGQGGSPGSVKIGANRSPGQRVSSGSYSNSPLPPALPAKEADNSGPRDARPESSNRSSELSDKSSDGPGTESVKIRGHRKRPSASFAAGSVPGPTVSDEGHESVVPRARPTSIGLGLSYNKDSPSSSSWSGGSPSLKADSEAEGQTKRSSAASQSSST